jgi:hypothetical protein
MPSRPDPAVSIEHFEAFRAHLDRDRRRFWRLALIV